MADTNPFSMDAWLQAQRTYWDAWTEISKQAMNYANPVTAAAPTNWAEGLQKWWGMAAPAAPQPAQDFYNKLVASGNAYLRMLEEMAKTAQSGAGSWQEMFDKSSEIMLGAFRQPPYAAATTDWTQPWQQAMSAWQQAMTSSPAAPSEWLQGLFPQFPGAAQLREQMQQLLNMPGVGFYREMQGQYQTLGQLMLDYESALNEFGRYIGDIAQRSMKRMQQLVSERNDPITSGRELYNLWVDACEEVFADAALSDEYSRLYGSVTNNLMAVQKQGSAILDETLETLNLPNRRELDTLQKRVHDLRRENRQLRSGLVELRQEIDQLKANKTAAAPRRSSSKSGTAGKAAPAADSDSAQ